MNTGKLVADLPILVIVLAFLILAFITVTPSSIAGYCFITALLGMMMGRVFLDVSGVIPKPDNHISLEKVYAFGSLFLIAVTVISAAVGSTAPQFFVILAGILGIGFGMYRWYRWA